ncbi:hypothetical protein VCUG_00225 [Vavraia culicis subsp. floridensis]|uniref:Uncharacterized protein n=1 Tax=Vavraia culicis (isolate floridensis) TaxID=948595 RepID=L2GXQ0_VAVCU|nr:uncharacterized protein VCUG_00225 [Vavraia culicis subsp. floridensis]ELA48389.1 hypothetical protein VCUG_00225 [Vavraia culicis subsp. floridensis]
MLLKIDSNQDWYGRSKNGKRNRLPCGKGHVTRLVHSCGHKTIHIPTNNLYITAYFVFFSEQRFVGKVLKRVCNGYEEYAADRFFEMQVFLWMIFVCAMAHKLQCVCLLV